MSAFDGIQRWLGADAPSPEDGAPPPDVVRRRRNRRVFLSTATALVARGATLAATLLVIPLGVGYLGVERYGVFVALTSLTAILAFSDLGLGNGLLNVLSDAYGRNDRETARRAVSSAFFGMVAVAGLAGVLVLLAYDRAIWSQLFPATDPSLASEIQPTATVIFAAFVISLPLAMVDKVRLAYQEGYVSSIATTAGAVGAIGSLLVVISVQGSLPALALAITIPPLAAMTINALVLFLHDRRWLLPRFKYVDRGTVIQLARLGFLFFVLQLAVAVAFQSGVVVAATTLGPEAAATYSITMRLFMIVPAIVATYLSVLWPAYTEAIAREDVAWVMRIFRKSTLAALIASGLSSGLLVIVGASLISALTDSQVEPPTALLFGAAIWAVVYATFNSIAILMNAASVVRFQAIVAVLMACASIALSVVLAEPFGVSGVVWGTVIAYVVVAGIPILLYLPNVLRKVRDGAGAIA